MPSRIYDKKLLEEVIKGLLGPYKETVAEMYRAVKKAGLEPPEDAAEDDPVPNTHTVVDSEEIDWDE